MSVTLNKIDSIDHMCVSLTGCRYKLIAAIPVKVDVRGLGDSWREKRTKQHYGNEKCSCIAGAVQKEARTKTVSKGQEKMERRTCVCSQN